MMANGSNTESAVGPDLGQTWSDAWHLWRVIIPRRSIAGRLVWGMVWRRHRGGRWMYKKFVEYSGDDDPKPISQIKARVASAGLPDISSRAPGSPLEERSLCHDAASASESY